MINIPIHLRDGFLIAGIISFSTGSMEGSILRAASDATADRTTLHAEDVTKDEGMDYPINALNAGAWFEKLYNAAIDGARI